MLKKALLLGVITVASSFAAPINYISYLSGGAESPANSSAGTGVALVTLDSVANTMRVQVTFSGLTGTTTNSHIHCCLGTPFTGTTGVATLTPTFTGFPGGVTSGMYDATYDMTLASSYNAAFVTANGGTAASAKTALFNGIATPGVAYLNIHTSTFGGGEIRGFFTVAPEPGTFGLMGAAVLGLGFAARRKARS